MPKSYSEKLKDPRWQKKRLEILERDQWMCRRCCDKTETLHVHHTQYRSEPWDVPSEFLLTLCKECHDRVEEYKSKIGRMLCDSIVCGGIESAVDLLDGDCRFSHSEFLIRMLDKESFRRVILGIYHHVEEGFAESWSDGYRSGQSNPPKESAV
jgi:hypothetical protein